MAFKAAKGDTLHFRASGPDAEQALSGAARIGATRRSTRAPGMAERRLVGRPAAQGFACGPLAPLGRIAKPAERVAGAPQEERGRLAAAIAEALSQLEALLGAAEGDGADILAFQVAMLEDPELSDPAFAALDEGAAAEAAWGAALGRQIADYESSDDRHFRARASDIADIRDRVLAALAGSGPEGTIAPGSIVLARDLSPSRFLSTDWSQGGAIALTAGSAHGHVATLARARGVPMIVGLGIEPEAAEAGALALVDGGEATLWLDPAPATRAAFEARAARAGVEAASAAAFLDQARAHEATAPPSPCSSMSPRLWSLMGSTPRSATASASCAPNSCSRAGASRRTRTRNSRPTRASRPGPPGGR